MITSSHRVLPPSREKACAIMGPSLRESSVPSLHACQHTRRAFHGRDGETRLQGDWEACSELLSQEPLTNWLTESGDLSLLFTVVSSAHIVAPVESLSRVRLFATPWTAARQAPLSMGFPRQEYWSGLPFPSPLHVLSHLMRSHSVRFSQHINHFHTRYCKSFSANLPARKSQLYP